QIPQYFDLIAIAVKAFVAVKLASWLASTGGALARGAAAFNTYSGAVLSATIQGQRLTTAQRVLMLRVRNTNAWLLAQENRLRANAAASRGAQLSALAFANTLAVLRNGILAVAAVA